MGRIAAALAVALLLAGCHTTSSLTWKDIQAIQARHDAECRKDGEKPGTQGYQDCRKFLADQEVRQMQAHENARRRLGAALVTMGAGMQAYQAAHRPVSCYSSRIGSFVTTNCY
jgi:hypothetical protein